MDSSRLSSRVTQEEERAGYGGATAQARTIEIKKKKRKQKKTKQQRNKKSLVNVYIPGGKRKDSEQKRPLEDGETTEEVKEKGVYGY